MKTIMKTSNRSGGTSAITIERTRNHLQSLLKVKQIQTQLNQEILTKTNCVNSILSLFGTQFNLLDHLTQYATKQQLDEMYSILQQSITEYKFKQKSKKPATQIYTHVVSNFDKISDQTTENIFSFINKYDISQIKTVSR
eukprot:500789_1